MSQILGTSWGRNTISATLAAILFVLLGVAFRLPLQLTLLGAATFGAMMIIVVQLSMVVWAIWTTRGSPSPLGETTLAEVETPEGKQELNHMSFHSLLTVAIVQELYVSLFKRDKPMWAWEFVEFGAAEDYGMFNRYLEWMLIIALSVFTLVSALLISWISYAVVGASSGSTGFNFLALLCALPAFFVGALLMFPLGLFFASVVRRMGILYAARAEGSKIT